jgi:hypothetical protein
MVQIRLVILCINMSILLMILACVKKNDISKRLIFGRKTSSKENAKENIKGFCMINFSKWLSYQL